LEYQLPTIIGQARKGAMSLLVVYVVLMIIGDLVAYFIGLVIERNAPVASLPAFLAMYFLFLWVAWVIAVRITRPKTQPQ
jgi:cation transporter-like permease